MRLTCSLLCVVLFLFAVPDVFAEHGNQPTLEVASAATQAEKEAPVLVLTEEEQAWIAAHPRVRVGLYSIPPYIFSELGQAKGYLVDLVQKVFDQAGLTPVFSPMLPLETKLNQLRSHELDVGVGLVKTPLREEFLTFTESPMRAQIGIYALRDRKDIVDEQSVAGKTIASYHGYALGDRYLRKFTKSRIRRAKNADGMLRLVSHGEADLAFQEVNSANYLLYSSNYNNLELKGYVPEQFIFSALATDKSQPLLASILDKSYAALHYSQRNTLRKYWFEDLEKPFLSSDEQAYLQAHPLLTVGHSLEFAPFLIERAPGEYDGMIVDVYNTVAKRLGIEVKYVADSWENTIRSLQQGQVDVIAMINSQVAQKKNMLVADAVFDNVFQVYLNQNNAFPVTSLEDLVGKRIVYQDSIIILDKFLASYQGRMHLIPAKNGLEAFTLLHDGKADAFIGFKSLSYLLLKHHFTDIHPVYTLNELVVDTVAAIKPGAVLLQSCIAKALRSISFQEKMEIAQRWFGKDTEHDSEPLLEDLLTHAEQESLASLPKLNVCARLDHYPLVGIKQGRLVGIAGEITDTIFERLHLTYNPIMASSKKEEYQLIRDNKCDVIVPIKDNYQTFANTSSTVPIYTSIFNSIGNMESFFIDDYTDFSGHRFYVKETLHQKMVHEYYPQLSVEVLEDIDEVMRILAEDKNTHLINIGIINEYLINKYGIHKYKLNGELDQLKITGSLGVHVRNRPLIAIFNKAIGNLGDEEIARIVNRYELRPQAEPDYRFVGYATAIFGIISFFLMYRNFLLKKNNRALGAEKGRFEAFMRNASDGILILDKEVNILESNLKIQRMLGYSAQELQARTMYAINKNLTKEMAENNIGLLLEGNEQLVLEAEYTRKDGTTLQVAITASLLELDGQICIYTSLRDISEQKDAEERLKAAMDEAQAANRAKSIFLSNMSHELRTPLNAILGYTQLYSHDASLTSKQQAGIQTIHSAGEHLLMLINDILDLSKIEAGKLGLLPQEVALGSFLENIVKISNMRCQEKGINLRFEPDAALPSLVVVDALRLRQVLFNLLSNAVKFTNKGYCSLQVQAQPLSEEQTRLQFTVSDSGPGIAREDQKKVFDPFCQAGERLKYSQGTGLGLTISRQLVELMGGQLTLESPIHPDASTELGPGSRFSFFIDLPSSYDELMELNNGEGVVYSFPHIDQGSKTVLIVDDRTSNRAVLRDTLEPLGFVTLEAENGRLALECCAEMRPDLIFMDLQMPEVDGFTAIGMLRQDERFADIPVIAITASLANLQGLKEKCLSAGFNRFLSKPFDTTDLLEASAALLHLELVQDRKESQVEQEMPVPEQDVLSQIDNHLQDGNIEAIIELADVLKLRESGHYHAFATHLEALASDIRLTEIEQFIQQHREA